MYQAQILADSISIYDERLTTFQITYPRFVHSELLTHRMFSRNSASSRAIPVEKMWAQIQTDPVTPVWWGKQQSGMQAKEELPDIAVDDLVKFAHSGDYRDLPDHMTKYEAELFWLKGRFSALNTADKLYRGGEGLHKQIVNRITEPWMWITVIVSATEWDNFFQLRCHEDAQPEIRKIAEMMQDLYLINEDNYDANLSGEFGELVHGDNAPLRLVKEGDWHLPYWNLDSIDRDLIKSGWGEEVKNLWGLPNKVLASAGRCARVSYLTHEGQRDPKADVALAIRLAQSKHWSPWEHVATPFSEHHRNLIRVLQDTVTLSDHSKRMSSFEVNTIFRNIEYSGNFWGWLQARKFFSDENGEGHE